MRTTISQYQAGFAETHEAVVGLIEVQETGDLVTVSRVAQPAPQRMAIFPRSIWTSTDETVKTNVRKTLRRRGLLWSRTVSEKDYADAAKPR